LVNINGIRITYQEAAIGAGAITGIVIAIIVAVCCAVAYWKKNKVVEISLDIKERVSIKIRESFKLN